MSNLYEVTYDILVQPRTSTFLGQSRSDLQNIKTVVSANGPNQAQQIVEAQNGGYSNCLVKNARPV